MEVLNNYIHFKAPPAFDVGKDGKDVFKSTTNFNSKKNTVSGFGKEGTKKGGMQKTINNKQNQMNSAEQTGIIKEVEATIKPKELIKRVILTDSEDRWFLNPQYKVEMKPSTKLIITLLQADEMISKIPYQKCNFMIIMTRVFILLIKNRENIQECGI